MAERIITWIIMMICIVLLLAEAVSLVSGHGFLSPWVLVGTGIAGFAVYYRNATRRR